MSRLLAHERLRHLNVPSRYDVKLVHSASDSSMLNKLMRFFYRAVKFGSSKK